MKDWQGNYSQFDVFIADFLKGNLPYGSWADHMVEWRQLHEGRKLFLCYEDFTQSPKLYLRQIVSFIGLNYDEVRADKALDNANADNVSRITNDKIFYGKEFTTFVKSPFGVGKQMKEQLRSQYASQFYEWNRLYEEFRVGTKN